MGAELGCGEQSTGESPRRLALSMSRLPESTRTV